MSTHIRARRNRPAHWTRLIGSAVLSLALVVPAAACTDTSTTDTSNSPGAATGSVPATSPSTPADQGGQGGQAGHTGPGGEPTTRPSAADQLAAFFTKAAEMDAQLREAAKLINGDIRRDAIVLQPATIAAVRKIKLADVARTIPSGMYDRLQRSVLLVYSELVSRRLAMRRIDYAGTAPIPRTSTPAKDLLNCLGNGASAARRFANDLAALRSLAVVSARIKVPAPSARSVAERALRVLYIDMANGGCAQCGGSVSTKLAAIVWERHGDFEGTIGPGTLYFDATYRPGKGWQVAINAC